MMNTKKMLPFEGYISPGINFSSGYCIWLLNWDATPTPIHSFSQVWVFDPKGKRTAFIDPIAAKEIFHQYHTFDSVVEGQIVLEEQNDRNLMVSLQSSTGDRLEMRLSLGDSFKTDSISESKTETGLQVKHHSHTMRVVEHAEGTINGTNLGEIQPPPQPIYVGTAAVGEKPVISYCTHYLEP